MDSDEANRLFNEHIVTHDHWGRVGNAFGVPDWLKGLWASVLLLVGDESIAYVDGQYTRDDASGLRSGDLVVYTDTRMVRARVMNAGAVPEATEVWTVARSSLARVEVDRVWGWDPWPPDGVRVRVAYPGGDAFYLPRVRGRET